MSKIFYAGDGVNEDGLSRKRIREGCDQALLELGVDHIDLLLCHVFDKKTPIEETVFGMDQLVRSGKILYWGTSNWPAAKIEQAIRISRAHGLFAPVTEQTCYNLMYRKALERSLAKTLAKTKMGLTTYSPLNSGYLTGKYMTEVPQNSRLQLERFAPYRKELIEGNSKKYSKMMLVLNAIANELGCTISQLAIAWCLKNKNVTSVILGATSCEQLIENIGSLKVFEKLSPELLKKMSQASVEMAQLD